MSEILFFFSQSCQPCKAMKPKVELFCAAFNVPLRYVDAIAEESLPLVDQYAVRMVPTIVALRDGEMVCKGTGLYAWDPEEVRQKLRL